MQTEVKSEGIVLYNYFRSSASFRVRIALNLKQIKYEYVAVHLLKDQQKTEDYIKKNPMMHVPSLQIDGINLFESLPIIEYLEETRPEPALFPKDPKQRAQVRIISEIINSGIQPLQNLKVNQKIENDLKGDKAAWNVYWIESGLKALEATLKASKGKFCVGDSITMADCVLVPQVFASQRFGVNIDNYPTIKAIYDNLKDIPEIKAAFPANQPDAE